MLYPNTIRNKKLGFDKPRERLKELCISSLGQNYVEKIRFSENFGMVEKVRARLPKCSAFSRTSGEKFLPQNYIDATPYLKRASIEGMFLTQAEFSDLKVSLLTIRFLSALFRKPGAGGIPYSGRICQDNQS